MRDCNKEWEEEAVEAEKNKGGWRDNKNNRERESFQSLFCVCV